MSLSTQRKALRPVDRNDFIAVVKQRDEARGEVERLRHNLGIAQGYAEAAAVKLMKLKCPDPCAPNCPRCIASNQLSKVLAALDADVPLREAHR